MSSRSFILGLLFGPKTDDGCVQRYKRAFLRFDSDNSGEISVFELATAFKSLDIDYSRTELEQMLDGSTALLCCTEI